MRKPKQFRKVGDKFSHPLYGSFEIITYVSSKHIIIRFHQTGTETKVQANDINTMRLRDYNYPTVFGVGFRGYGRHKTLIDRKITPSYYTWRSMIQRCYDEDCKGYRFYGDCTVCDEWHNFQNFAEWFEENKIDGYHLDKDSKVKGNRVYSPETCIFLPMKENVKLATQKSHSFRSPSGDIVNFVNLNEFCEINNLDRVCMSRVKSGQRKSHKGWTRA